jgi:hypothetical protein
LRNVEHKRRDVGDAGKGGEREKALVAKFRPRPADRDRKADIEKREDKRRLDFERV